MASPPSSESAVSTVGDPEMDALRLAVRGQGRRPGLVDVLPRLQRSHRKLLVRNEMWTKGELARHPEPREVIRSMRRPGNVDEKRRVVQTFDARRTMIADVHENRVVRYTVEEVLTRLIIRSRAGNDEANTLLPEERRLAITPHRADRHP